MVVVVALVVVVVILVVVVIVVVVVVVVKSSSLDMVVVVVVLIPSQPLCRTPDDHSLSSVRSKCRGLLDIHNERSPVREPRRATTSPGRQSHNIGLSRSCMPTDHSWCHNVASHCTPHCRHKKMPPWCCRTATPMLPHCSLTPTQVGPECYNWPR